MINLEVLIFKHLSIKFGCVNNRIYIATHRMRYLTKKKGECSDEIDEPLILDHGRKVVTLTRFRTMIPLRQPV